MGKPDQYYFLPIVQPLQWQCCPFVWVSLLRVFLKTGRWCQQLLGQQIRKAENLLEVSARFGLAPLASRKETTLADPFMVAWVKAVRL